MNKELIVMDNSIVTSAYNLTLNEQRLIYCVLKKIPIQEKIDPKTPFYISREDFIALGADPSNVAKEIRQATRDLRKKSIYVQTPTGEREFGWVTDIFRFDRKAEQKLREQYPNPEDYKQYLNALKLYNLYDALTPYKVDDDVVARIVFDERIIPLLTDLRENFTQFSARDIAEFKSIYSFRIYQLIMRYKSTGYVKISFDELRFMLMLTNKYSYINDLKKRVIDVAIDEINKKSPYSVQYELIKKGRKFTHLELKFEPKNKEKIEKTKVNNNRNLNTKNIVDNLTDQEREIIANKNAYADQKGITDPLHRQNLINQALKQHRQAEQDEKAQQEREKAKRQAEQAKEQAEKQAQETLEKQKKEQKQIRQDTMIAMFEGLTAEQQDLILDEVCKKLPLKVFVDIFKKNRQTNEAHKNPMFAYYFYELFEI